MKFSDLSARGGKPGPRDRAHASVPPSSPETAPPAERRPPRLPLDEPLPDFIQAPVPPPFSAGAPATQAAAAPVAPQPRKVRPRREPAQPRPPERPFGELDRQAREVYARNLSLAKELLTRADQPFVEKFERIDGMTALNSGILAENPVLLTYTFFATADDYLYAHSANVALLSQAVGLAMGLGKGDLSLLGFCALLHDIGMLRYSRLANGEAKLSQAEFEEVTAHAREGAAKIDGILGMDPQKRERAKRIISQVHERIDASGYPDRLVNEEIDELAQIIGLADVYEAMTHPRAWRTADHPHKVIKHLIDKEGKGFNSRIVKAIIDVLSIYPPGSLVELSTGEIARVVKTRRGALTRPAVSVLLDRDFASVPQSMIDLTEHPLTGIDRIVEDGELNSRNPKFAALQELSRWWVEW